MNKIISTKERIFISLVGPSGSGKSHLIFYWLKIGTFKPAFDNIFYFYQYYQPLYSQMQRKNLKFIQGVDFDLIENLPNNGTKYLLILDDSLRNFKLQTICKNCHCWEMHVLHPIDGLPQNKQHQWHFELALLIQ